MSHLHLVVDREPTTADRLGAQHEVDRLLRRIRLAVCEREALELAGAPAAELERQSREIAVLRARLAALVSGGGPYPSAA